MYLAAPLAVIAGWPAPNRVDPESLGPALLAVTITMTIITTIVICIRIYSRVYISKSFGTDDWLIVGAFISFIAYISVVILEIQEGIGLHLWDFLAHPEAISPTLKHSFICCLIFVTSLCLTKLSILFYYKTTIFTPTAVSQRMIKLLRVTIWVVAIWGILFFISMIFQCWPVSQYWDFDLDEIFDDSKQHNCSTVPLLALAFTDIPIDVLIIVLPIKAVWALQTNVRKRLQIIGLLTVFSLSIIAGASIIQPVISTTRSYDISWKTSIVFILGVIELSVAIICASVLAIRTAYKTFRNNTKKDIPNPPKEIFMKDPNNIRRGHQLPKPYSDISSFSAIGDEELGLGIGGLDRRQILTSAESKEFNLSYKTNCSADTS